MSNYKITQTNYVFHIDIACTPTTHTEKKDIIYVIIIVSASQEII